MHTLRLSLLLLLSLAAGCRELGQYLPPEKVKSCLDGSSTEDCPDALSPTASVTFRQPAIGPNVLNPNPAGRYAPVEATVVSTLDIDRVDLQCAGLQLASWRPGRVREVALTGTVDLLPCRTAATSQAPDASGVVLHAVPLEVAVFDPVGARVLLGDLRVLANLSDTRLPGTDVGGGPDATRLTITIGRGSNTLQGLLPAGVELQVEVRSTSGAKLTQAPEIRVNGIRQDVLFTSSEEGVAWTGQLAGLSPRSRTTAEVPAFDGFLQHAEVVISALGTAEGASAGIRQQTFLVDRVREVAPGPVTLGSVGSLLSAAGLTFQAPVTTEAGTLFFDYSNEPTLFRTDGTLQTLTRPADGINTGNIVKAIGFSARGGVLWESRSTGDVLSGYFLQNDLSATPVFTAVPGFEEGPYRMMRLGDGRICQERVVSPNLICNMAPDVWTLTCMGPGSGAADIQTVAVPFPGTVAIGQPRLHTLLDQGWISTGYQTLAACVANQAAGLWGSTARTNFSITLAEPDYTFSPIFVGMAAGPRHAVIGHQSATFGLQLELLDAENGNSLGNFPGLAIAGSPQVEELLFARPDGAVVSLSPEGVLSRWLPGPMVEPVRFDLVGWMGSDAHAPYQIRPDVTGTERLSGLPHVAHSNGNVTFALVDGEGRPVVLELDDQLRPVWVWRAREGSGRAPIISGLPDRPFVDLVIVGDGFDTAIYRLAR